MWTLAGPPAWRKVTVGPAPSGSTLVIVIVSVRPARMTVADGAIVKAPTKIGRSRIVVPRDDRTYVTP